MRIYGSSPMYNYVDLVFRCKKMFIITILLGSVICSTFLYLRGIQYEIDMEIGLTGDPNTASAQPGASTIRKSDSYAAAIRKARRLKDIWLKLDPTFLRAVLTNAKLDQKYGNSMDD